MMVYYGFLDHSKSLSMSISNTCKLEILVANMCKGKKTFRNKNIFFLLVKVENRKAHGANWVISPRKENDLSHKVTLTFLLIKLKEKKILQSS